MIRCIRLKLSATQQRIIHAKATATLEAQDPYGVAYGAGPSRLSYQPSHSPKRLYANENARVLRKSLANLSHGSYALPAVFVRSLQKAVDKTGAIHLDDAVSRLSRLNLHIIVHHLIRQKKGNLAAAIILQALKDSPRMARRRVISPKSLSVLFRDRNNFSFLNSVSYSRKIPPNLSPTVHQQSSPPPSIRLQTILDMLEILQDVRYRRPAEMYLLTIKACCDESLFHLAAKVYVGLVEEWITEGRVAEGAHPDDFHPGGGPPRGWNKEEGDRWWTGVRTWRWPGEVLSPHDRLDLWHPRHLSLPEKMRNFPVPLATSPPTLVPHPHSSLLNAIILSLKLDPTQVAPHEFASSMRALAILSNTVLSRTLPILGLHQLLRKCKDAPFKPDVYPEGMSREESEDAWAYTAFTQVHVTLMSLLWSPPISAGNMGLIVAAQNAELASQLSSDTPCSAQHCPLPTYTYSLPPLSLQSCTLLLSYAFRKLKAPSLLTSLLDYMRNVFGRLGVGKNVNGWNEIIRGAGAVGLSHVADDAAKVLLGDVGKDNRRMDEREMAAQNKMGINKAPKELVPALQQELSMLEQGEVEANEQTLLAFIHHLAATSQFPRLVTLIYTLIPYLAHSRHSSHILDDTEGLEVGASGRPKSSKLMPKIYLSLLKALERAGRVGLAQRIFGVALYEERAAWEAYHTANPLYTSFPGELRCSQELFTTMLQTYSQLLSPPSISLKGIKVPKYAESLSVGDQVAALGLDIHHLARTRWKEGWIDKAEMKGSGGERYWRGLMACCWSRWNLASALSSTPNNFGGLPPLSRPVEREMIGVMKDMEAWGISAPEIMRARLQGRKIDEGSRLFWQKGQGRSKERKGDAEKLLKRIMGET
ncbi:uncharacterized protein L203_102172 [Cryptococcus depauperatus CBS 7841]|uniref:Uncharacterized protein n=1 Tax=Cryptococcus depauperatus CBS 7841 TaxID=1295531 RepID=A0A1E3IRZ6_9TREE|nr:hypothetical protein L203_01428 [Cryptococcus depauperatus CBS 7841]